MQVPPDPQVMPSPHGNQPAANVIWPRVNACLKTTSDPAARGGIECISQSSPDSHIARCETCSASGCLGPRKPSRYTATRAMDSQRSRDARAAGSQPHSHPRAPATRARSRLSSHTCSRLSSHSRFPPHSLALASASLVVELELTPDISHGSYYSDPRPDDSDCARVRGIYRDAVCYTHITPSLTHRCSFVGVRSDGAVLE
ncbi:hypothetical protein C2E23DRAFT_564444 [Lenzites betulinus]|nr:hypothetical protein C2E23DRAFT_564444 [Lenzites betulinus]